MQILRINSYLKFNLREDSDSLLSNLSSVEESLDEVEWWVWFWFGRAWNAEVELIAVVIWSAVRVKFATDSISSLCWCTCNAEMELTAVLIWSAITIGLAIFSCSHFWSTCYTEVELITVVIWSTICWGCAVNAVCSYCCWLSWGTWDTEVEFITVMLIITISA